MVQGGQTLEPCLGTLGEGSMALATGMDIAHRCSGAGMSLANLVSIQSSFGAGILRAIKGWHINTLNHVPSSVFNPFYCDCTAYNLPVVK